MQIVSTNRKAQFDFIVGKEYEAGLVLSGLEVKGLREKQVSISEAWIKIENNIPKLIGCSITPSKIPTGADYNPNRTKILLLRKQEIRQLEKAIQQGSIIIPLQLYFSPKGIGKLKIAEAKHVKKYDKRQSTRNRDFQKHGSES